MERKRESDRKGMANSRSEWKEERERRDSGVEKDETRGRERKRGADIGYFYEKLLARRVNICMVV